MDIDDDAGAAARTEGTNPESASAVKKKTQKFERGIIRLLQEGFRQCSVIGRDFGEGVIKTGHNGCCPRIEIEGVDPVNASFAASCRSEL